MVQCVRTGATEVTWSSPRSTLLARVPLLKLTLDQPAPPGCRSLRDSAIRRVWAKVGGGRLLSATLCHTWRRLSRRAREQPPRGRSLEEGGWEGGGAHSGTLSFRLAIPCLCAMSLSSVMSERSSDRAAYRQRARPTHAGWRTSRRISRRISPRLRAPGACRARSASACLRPRP